MHDPYTVAFEIKSPFKEKNSNYRRSLITIWHKDPCKLGSDDSCGWFKRAHHGNVDVLNNIRKDFKFNWDYWFDPQGWPKFSVGAVLLNMYNTACWNHFKHNRKKKDAFMRKHTYDILYFAENPSDSLYTSIASSSKDERKRYRIDDFSSIIYGDIIRKSEKWYQHPRWHIHHWRIQINFLQEFKRRWWDKCCVCGKRGFKSSAMSDWDGTKRWHQECDTSTKSPIIIHPIEIQ